MSKYIPTIPKAVSIWLISLCLTGFLIAEKITFKFNPVLEKTCIATVKKTTKTTIDESKTRIDELVVKSRSVIHSIPSGFEIVETPISILATRDGKPVLNPVLQLIHTRVIKLVVDHDGHFVYLSGFEGLLDNITAQLKQLPPNLTEKLAAALNEETLIKRTANEYNSRIGDFVGSTVEPGETFSFESEVPIACGGTLKYFGIITFDKMTPCGNTQCLRITYDYNSDPKGFENVMGDVFDGMEKATGAAAPEFELSNASLTGECERLIDPDTMRIYSETIKRTMTFVLSAPGEGKHSSTRVEETTYSYEYE